MLSHATSYELVLLIKGELYLGLVWHPETKRIVYHICPFENGETIFQWADIAEILSKFLSNGWKEVERRTIYGHEIGTTFQDICKVQQLREAEVQAPDNS